MKLLPMIIFLSISSLILLLLHQYVLFRSLGFFSIPFGLTLKNLFIVLALSLLFPLTTLIDKLYHSFFTRILYIIACTWLWTVFFLFSIFVVIELINLIYPVFNNSIFGILLLSLALIITIYALFNATSIKIEEVNIDNFGKELKIVHLSDIHIGSYHNSEYLEKVVQMTNELNPDLVLITGDLVDGSGKVSSLTFKPLSKLNANAFLINGNHEFYAGLDDVEIYLKDTNVTVLRNNISKIKGINIIGLEYTSDEKQVVKNLKSINYDKSKPTILLNHEPIGYEFASENGVNLQLSGHTHNGQIFPFTLLVKLRYSKIKGLYKIGNMSLYVSPGTGTWGPPMRLGSNNEITLINLK